MESDSGNKVLTVTETFRVRSCGLTFSVSSDILRSSRPLRIEYPGAVYHITSRGNEKKAVFKDDEDRDNFLNTLQHVNKRYN